jgi:regulatory protein
VAVYVDGGLAFELAEEVAARANLDRGEFLSEERQAALLAESQPLDARERAVSLLSRRELSRHDVGLRLRRAGYPDAVVDETLRWLEERGYVDDRRYAALYAGERAKAGWGRRRIVSELRKRGVSGESVADEATDDLTASGEPTDEMEAVLSLARRRFQGQIAGDVAGTERRLASFLARRGHDWDTIGRVMRRLYEESQSDQSAASDPPD